MVRSVLRTISVFCAFSSLAFAQGAAPAEGTGAMDRDSQIEKLVADWNERRNSANTEALPEVFHPDDRATAAEFYASQRPASVRARVLGIQQAAGGRVNVRVERSWGGAKPGKTVDTLQASAVDGQWFLRIPGGSLKVAAKPSAAPAPIAKPAAPVTQAPEPVAPPAPVPQAPPAPVQAQIPPPAPAVAAAPPSAPEPKPVPAPAAPSAAKGQETAPITNPETRRFENWTRICETAKVNSATCFLQASLANSADKKPIMRWRVQVLEDKSAASVILIPAGVTLAPGLTLSLSKEQPTQVPFRACNGQNCEVRFKMEPDLVETVGKRSDVPVKFVNQAGELVEFSVPMKGFREGVNSIRSGKK